MGNSAQMECFSVGSIIWYRKSGKRIPPSIVTDPILKLNNLSAWHIDTYLCNGTVRNGVPFTAGSLLFVASKNIICFLEVSISTLRTKNTHTTSGHSKWLIFEHP